MSRDASGHSRELDPEVVRQALHGEGSQSRRAFERLYWHYEPRVRYGVARAAQVKHYQHDVAELRQEVWYRLVARERWLLRYYDPSRGALGPFIELLSFQQALKAIEIDRRRAVASGKPTVEEDMVEDRKSSRFVAELIQSDIYRKLMQRAAESLNETDQLFLREIHLAQRPIAEVALEHGLKLDASYTRNLRLKRKLKEWAKELLQDSRPGSSPDPVNASMPPVAVIVAMLMAALAAPERDDADASDRAARRASPAGNAAYE